MRVERPGVGTRICWSPGLQGEAPVDSPWPALSLQRHCHRSESWTVVAGDGALLCGERWVAAKAGLMLSIPCGAVHRARSETSDLVILEVQHGDDLREDDIERLQDEYGRVIN